MSAKFKDFQMDTLNIRKWTGDVYKDKDSILMISILNGKNYSKWALLINKKIRQKKYVSFLLVVIFMIWFQIIWQEHNYSLRDTYISNISSHIIKLHLRVYLQMYAQLSCIPAVNSKDCNELN